MAFWSQQTRCPFGLTNKMPFWSNKQDVLFGITNKMTFLVWQIRWPFWSSKSYWIMHVQLWYGNTNTYWPGMSHLADLDPMAQSWHSIFRPLTDQVSHLVQTRTLHGIHMCHYTPNCAMQGIFCLANKMSFLVWQAIHYFWYNWKLISSSFKLIQTWLMLPRYGRSDISLSGVE